MLSLACALTYLFILFTLVLYFASWGVISCISLMAFSLHQLTALHIAAERGYIEIVEYLVVKGADIDIQDNEDKVTLFH